MLKLCALLFALTLPASLQGGASIPFGVQGGGMQVAGTFSLGPGGGIVANGSVNMNGEVVPFGPVKPIKLAGGGSLWLWIVVTDENIYQVGIVYWPGLAVTGYWWETGTTNPRTLMF